MVGGLELAAQTCTKDVKQLSCCAGWPYHELLPPANGRVCCGLLLTARWSVVRLGGVPKGFLISLLTHWPPRSSMRLRRWPSSSNRRRLLPSIHRQRPATHPQIGRPSCRERGCKYV